jgi:hypothetical protein
MRALSIAVEDLFEGSALSTAVAGRMYSYEAPENTPFPYIIHMAPVNETTYTMDTKHNEVDYVFNIVAELGEADEAAEILDLLTALYDDCDLSVSGYTFKLMEQRRIQQSHEPGEEWVFVVQYKVFLEGA